MSRIGGDQREGIENGKVRWMVGARKGRGKGKPSHFLNILTPPA